MNIYKKNALEATPINNPKLYVFYHVLGLLGKINQPKILEIGCIKDGRLDSITNDGWSSFYWAEYIKNHGGTLVIVNSDEKSINVAKEMLADYLGIIDIHFICTDGRAFLRTYTDWDLVYLDGIDDARLTMEMYDLIHRNKTIILLDDANPGNKCDLVAVQNSDGSRFKVGNKYEMLVYYPAYSGPLKTNIKNLEIRYIREQYNTAYRNERAIELGFAEWFATKFQNDIIEIGAVTPYYSIYKNWLVYDLYDSHEKSIKQHIMDVNYHEKNVLCVSTIEHIAHDLGFDKYLDSNASCEALDKIIAESANYFITFPLGYHRHLEEHIRENYLNNYILLKRKLFNMEINEWEISPDQTNWNCEYLWKDKLVSFYGAAGVLCIVTNQKELLNN